MNQPEFNILVTNITAIANQAFTIQCGEFATAIASDDTNDLEPQKFYPDKHLDEFDFDEIIKSGYQQVDDLKEELGNAWDSADIESLESLLQSLPQDYADLSKQITGDELKAWVIHALEAQDESNFYQVHHYIMGLFDNGFNDEVYDLIREAIAFDETDNLKAVQGKIQPEHIKLDDFITAATIQSFNALQWLSHQTTLNDDQIIHFYESILDEPDTFEKVYSIISPSNTQHACLIELAKSHNQNSIASFLESKKQV